MLEENRKFQSEMNEVLKLRYDAVAFRMIKDPSEVPEGAYRPFKDEGAHLALCQALTLARVKGKTIYMEKQDQWCWSPLISYGMVDFREGTPQFDLATKVMGIEDPEKAKEFVRNFPRFGLGEYSGFLLAPLSAADFEPDAVLIYCRNYQLRSILVAVNYKTGEMLESKFTPFASCVYSIVTPIQEGCYRITIPDPGEFERGHTPEDDIIFTVPAQRIEEFRQGLGYMIDRGRNVNSFTPMIKENYEQVAFYKKLFKAWGLTGEEE